MSETILQAIRRDGFSFPSLTARCPELLLLKQVPQNPAYHAEGDVYCHTGMVCEALVNLPEWQNLSATEQELLFLAAAFHDIGKISCTKYEDGTLVSPRHTLVGAKLFQRTAYRETERFLLSFAQREFVTNAIRYHGLPVWFFKKTRPEAELLKAAECIPLRLLSLLAKADILGRQTTQSDSLMSQVEWFAEYAGELNVLEHPYPFTNPYTKSCFFLQDDLWQGATLYDSTEFDVTLLSGLPLVGKDHWAGQQKLPVISLDQLREERKLPPTKDSGKIAHLALTQAKGFLSKKQPFIWNATNLLQETRRKLIKLFADYHARVRILYLEVPYKELLTRNQIRARHIPENVLENMIEKLEIPAPWESYTVEYQTKNHPPT
ncbi:MAG: AAA family ATPase [Lachnospiraceae bacterium]|nr:AAA family ATPase [Lachnospiraceae bacterium]